MERERQGEIEGKINTITHFNTSKNPSKKNIFHYRVCFMCNMNNHGFSFHRAFHRALSSTSKHTSKNKFTPVTKKQ